MNKIDLTQTGGLWAYQDTLKFMQDTYTPLINAITAALGNNVIITGCIVIGSTVTSGWLIYNGELLPLTAGTLATNITLHEVKGNEQFNDGTQKQIYSTRTAILTNAAVGVPFSSFAPLKTLAAFMNLPTIATGDYSEPNDNALATITGLFNLRSELLNYIPPTGVTLDWAGAVSNIPTGWLLCDGRSLSAADYPALFAIIGVQYGSNGAGTFNLPNTLNRFSLGAGDAYGVGVTGGEATHELTISEMPPHSHSYTDLEPGNPDWGGGGYNGGDTHFANVGKTTGSQGSGIAHNNMPPFIAFPKIIKT